MGDSGEQLRWDDKRLFPAADPRRVRGYRRLQSWYRAVRLGARHAWLPPREATDERPAVPARPVGSLLAADEVKKRPTLNFLHGSPFADEIHEYVKVRSRVVHRLGGALDGKRLRHNMLSSMPLCFNLFVPLRNRPEVAAELLGAACGIECSRLDVLAIHGIDPIDGIECEWSPGEGYGLGDRTAFDAVVCYRDSTGRKCLLGIETKYIEPFSRTEYGKPDCAKEADRRLRYLSACRSGWFAASAGDVLWERATNQLWRNTMLASKCEALPDVDRVDVAVVHLSDDPHAEPALAGVRAQLIEPDHLKDVTIERLVDLAAAGEDRDLAQWALVFRERYLHRSQAAF